MTGIKKANPKYLYLGLASKNVVVMGLALDVLANGRFDGSITHPLVGCKCFDDLAIAPNQKLLKIPLYGRIEAAIYFFLGQKLVEGMHVVALDRDFGKHGKRHPILTGTKAVDVCIGPRFLIVETVGGKAKNDQPIFLIFFINLLQIGILGRMAAFRRHINNQQDLAFVTRHGDLVANNIMDSDVVNIGWAGAEAH